LTTTLNSALPNAMLLARRDPVSLSYFSKIVGGVEELWVTDGSVAGTRFVKPFNVLPFSPITVIGARAFFAIDDGVHGDELWMSDGTTSGTVMVKDITQGGSGSFPGFLTDVDGTLFFQAGDGVNGRELWKSDGTAAGTMMVKNINPGAGDSFPFSLIAINGTLFFSANDGTNGLQLWKTDGTAAGTVMVKTIGSGPAGGSVQTLTNVNGTLFFLANDATHGFELWKSDGTAAGTVMVKDINPGSGDSDPQGLTNLNGTLFFMADDGTSGTELWKSDGTAAGTVMVRDISPGPLGSLPVEMTNVNGTLFFQARENVDGPELWKTDGTTGDTVMVKDIFPGPDASFPSDLTNVNGILFFSANDGVHGIELWKSDGTAAGTVMVRDINPGIGGSSPLAMTSVNGALEFYAFDGIGIGLFRSDGTAAGTIELATNTNVDVLNASIGSASATLPDDFNGDKTSDVLWRNAAGGLADWSIHSGSIASSSFLTANGAVVAPDASWSVAGISDFNGDSKADVLWRNADGTLATWLMDGSRITSSATVGSGGGAIKPDASWSVAGVGDFDGDTRSDILWRNSSGELAEWQMTGATIASSADLKANGVAVRPDASWSVAGIGDFDGDSRRDILWRNTSGELVEWQMNGASVTSSADLAAGGLAARPDASWSIAGIGDFNGNGTSDLLWRNLSGALVLWGMSGANIASSATVNVAGVPLTPDASWHVVDVGDFNGDGSSDILWRNDSGALAEWLMNGATIVQSMTPTSNGVQVSPDGSWSTQVKATNFA
jgi:ELWxxDGT repeat protein